ncbi:MAG: glycosyltransferase family A protein [Solirubrobacterales bacterium]
MKLSLILPTFNSAETIERTLRAALAQTYRPLEIVIYDEASADDTRAIIERVLVDAPQDIETRLLTAEENSGAVKAWRVALHEITGDWCAFVWADDVLKPDYSAKMMAGAERAVEAGRKIVACSGEVENADGVLPYYSTDKGIATAAEYSEGIFMRRFPLTQICAVYETATAREVFDRHIQFDNPRDYDYNRHPYGNDVGYLSELAAEGPGVELIGERLVTLVDSSTSMTRQGTGQHIWQMRWQYTFNQLRVWRWWADRDMPGAQRLVKMGERRLALCSIMLGGNADRLKPANYVKAVLGYLDFRRLDYQRHHRTLDEHRARMQAVLA